MSDPYEFVGADRDANNRADGQRHAFNNFRLGDAANDEQPASSVQRRLVLVAGSTSEILFSLTPVGASDIVIPEVQAEEQTIVDAINSVTAVAAEPIEIELTAFELIESTAMVDFASNGTLAGFRLMASSDLENFDQDITNRAEVTELSNGNFQATVDLTGLGDQLFFRIEHDE